ncbi:hypothetical protein [Mycoplasmopsis alligatoris]|uniref:Lipoprotein n=1 Tax=Mycoplasmopsis alligatoris A21JP2 TaxID=747682 RepID=D4XWX1_9BACT|nr:hypothetical protein [Mycoplasmopsis alligatoris]EFF41360.1 hypothetical protein MALL_0293 [Mycoplasmopsis alligatoris A21JP2]
MSIKKKILIFTSSIISIATLFTSVSCSQRADEYKKNKLLVDEFILNNEFHEPPIINLEKHKESNALKDIELIQKNFRADTLWCLESFESPRNKTFNNKVFTYEISSVNHILGTTQAEIKIKVYLKDFLNEEGNPFYSRFYTVKMDGFKSTPINHKHWLKTDEKDSCEICMTYNN